MEALDVASTRTVDRALGLLEKQGAVLERDWQGSPRRLHWVMKKGPTWDESLSAHARLALRVALATLDQGGSNVWADHLKAFEHLADKHLSSRDRRVFEGLRTKVRVHGSVQGGPSPEGYTANLVRLLQVLGEPLLHKAVAMTYVPASTGVETTRPVVPYLLTHDVFSGGAFLLAWDVDHAKPLHFRLSRIRSVTLPGKTTILTSAQLADLERCAQYQIGGWTSPDEPFEIQARIHGRNWVQALLEAPPALPEAKVEPDGKDRVRLTFKATEMNAPTRWLLQFGPDAEVLGPEAFRRHVAERLKAAEALYASG
jgi:predicted DNA-binding transcriptional regulator YafY